MRCSRRSTTWPGRRDAIARRSLAGAEPRAALAGRRCRPSGAVPQPAPSRPCGGRRCEAVHRRAGTIAEVVRSTRSACCDSAWAAAQRDRGARTRRAASAGQVRFALNGLAGDGREARRSHGDAPTMRVRAHARASSPRRRARRCPARGRRDRRSTAARIGRRRSAARARGRGDAPGPCAQASRRGRGRVRGRRWSLPPLVRSGDDSPCSGSPRVARPGECASRAIAVAGRQQRGDEIRVVNPGRAAALRARVVGRREVEVIHGT